MPGHAAAMQERLPQLYREGQEPHSLVPGLLGLFGLQLELVDEDALAVQRAHWFDATFDFDEAVRLAALLGIAREPWQVSLEEFRAWVHALRDARLLEGSVTVSALQGFVSAYAAAYSAAVSIRVLPEPLVWGDSVTDGELVLTEGPLVRRYDLRPAVEPLQRFTLTQRGLDETTAAFLLVGLPDGPESIPVIANLTTGQALVYLGDVPTGQRLWLRPTAAGTVEARLEERDVTDRLRSIPDLSPGVPWSTEGTPATPITLARGDNELWFLTVAHYDVAGLDRFLLALADLLMTQGRYDSSQFDHALFAQAPAVQLRTTWLETEPASFVVSLPGGNLITRAGETAESLAERDRLQLSLDTAVGRLKAAGVRSAVTLAPYAEVQGQRDALSIVGAPRFVEVSPTGADRLTDAGGVFEVTGFNDSTYR